MRLEDLILYYEDEVNKTSGQAQFIAQSTVDFLRTAKEEENECVWVFKKDGLGLESYVSCLDKMIPFRPVGQHKYCPYCGSVVRYQSCADLDLAKTIQESRASGTKVEKILEFVGFGMPLEDVVKSYENDLKD